MLSECPWLFTRECKTDATLAYPVKTIFHFSDNRRFTDTIGAFKDK